MTTRPLTEQQKKVLGHIEEYSSEHGFPPTLREISLAAGIANINAVRGHLSALEKKGYITKDPDKARSIRILHSPSVLSRLRGKLHDIAHTDEGVACWVVFGLAWTTSQHREILTGQAKKLIEEAFEQECIEHGWKLLEKDVRPDHVRVIVEVWPNHSPEQVVRRFKRMANFTRRRHAKHFPNKELWRRGYVVTTDLTILDELVEQMLNEQEI